MKTIAVIIAQNGDMEALRRGDQLQVNHPLHPDLRIEYGGVGMLGGEIIKVSQLVPGVGDILVSPEMHFEVRKSGVWYPYYRRDDVLPVVSEAFVLKVHLANPNVMGFNLELQRGLMGLAQAWDHKLERQGYHMFPVNVNFIPLPAEWEETGAAFSAG